MDSNSTIKNIKRILGGRKGREERKKNELFSTCQHLVI